MINYRLSAAVSVYYVMQTLAQAHIHFVDVPSLVCSCCLLSNHADFLFLSVDNAAPLRVHLCERLSPAWSEKSHGRLKVYLGFQESWAQSFVSNQRKDREIITCSVPVAMVYLCKRCWYIDSSLLASLPNKHLDSLHVLSLRYLGEGGGCRGFRAPELIPLLCYHSQTFLFFFSHCFSVAYIMASVLLKRILRGDSNNPDR